MNLCYNQQKIILESKNNPLFTKNNECTFLKKGFKITIITEKGTRSKLKALKEFLENGGYDYE